jgi:ZIP family zinc transporter
MLSFTDVLGGASLALFATSAGAVLAAVLGKKGGAQHPGLLALSAGIMAYSAVEMIASAHKTMGDLWAIGFFALGVVLLLLSEKSIPHVHRWIKKSDLEPGKKKAALIAGTLTIHNLPEGFAIAAAFAGSTPLGWMVSSSIALQDAPEGFMVTAPLEHYGMKKLRALWYGLFSGIAEFAAALIGYIFLSAAEWLSPFALALSSGAMAYLVLVEIMPDAMANGKERIAGIWFVAGVAVAFVLATLFGF